MMDTLFAAGGLLEVQGQPFKLRGIPAAEWMDGLRGHMREYLGVGITVEAVNIILEASGRHPYKTMLAANRAHALAKFMNESCIDGALAFDAVGRARADRRWRLP